MKSVKVYFNKYLKSPNMIIKYNVGNNDLNEIFIEVHVGTAGEATTVVLLKLANTDDAATIAESSNHNGNIQKTLVGKAEKIKGGNLYIQSTIDLGILPVAQWPAATDTLIITYKLSGGVPDPFPFRDDPDDRTISDDGKIITVGKPIIFI